MPQSLNAFVVHSPARISQWRRDPQTAVAPVLPGQFAHVGYQMILIRMTPRAAKSIDVYRSTSQSSVVSETTNAYRALLHVSEATRQAIALWRDLPDRASVNLSESDELAVMALLDRMGVAIEARLASVSDAERFLAMP
ncbi:hypothetical protein [Boseongicola sp. H5]|uniref:hypothetical protein n=1 Tax=Boseongicola sp. H5 TaxID=2763261 RepID=UPI001D0B7B44|nr:hypothetical protein [Boseongicola sp. H5]